MALILVKMRLASSLTALLAGVTPLRLLLLLLWMAGRGQGLVKMVPSLETAGVISTLTPMSLTAGLIQE
jgi:hypothetical protein